VILAGPPNAGKSSLFNALLGVHAALVSPAAGTTRDYLTAQLNLPSCTVELIDTAGIDRSIEPSCPRQRSCWRRPDPLVPGSIQSQRA
jgi:tRNA modification GTPase